MLTYAMRMQVELRGRSEEERQTALHMLVHLPADPSLLLLDNTDANAMAEDMLLNVSDTILVEVKGEFKEVPYRFSSQLKASYSSSLRPRV
jgi:hypothetical protein